MSRQIIKQPNGKYAIWSTIIDDFVMKDVTPKEIVDEYVSAYEYEIAMEIGDIVKKLDNGEKPYHQFTKTYEECLKIKKEKNNV